MSEYLTSYRLLALKVKKLTKAIIGVLTTVIKTPTTAGAVAPVPHIPGGNMFKKIIEEVIGNIIPDVKQIAKTPHRGNLILPFILLLDNII